MTREHNPWVLFKDIPEEWEDGREVDLYAAYRIPLGASSARFTSCRFENDEWVDEMGQTFREGYTITHAMLPPNDPVI